MKKALLILSCVWALGAPSIAAAQRLEEQTPTPMRPPAAREVTEKVDQTQNIKTKIDEASPTRFVRTLTNVQIELSLTDQTGSAASDKKIVSMIASSGNWGRIRSSAQVFPIGDAPYAVQLNVDARPFVSVDGLIQVELTVEYAPIKGTGDPKTGPAQRPSGLNQSQTVVLQSGKPLIISQAADPVSDRKVVVEVKATVLK